MDCNTDPQIVTIIQGEDRDLFLRIVDKKTQQPFDLTAASAINARFKNADDSVLVKSISTGVTIISAAAGKIAVTILKTESILLKPREAQNFEIEVVIGIGASAKLSVVQFIEALTVKSRVV